MPLEKETLYSVQDLLDVVKTLRSPEGCPWDRKQTHSSMKPHLIEETYEVIDAIERKDMTLLQEELGDVLLQIALHSEIAKENGAFDFHSVVQGITEKMIRRHPHVFGDQTADDEAQALGHWEQAKQAEQQVSKEKALPHSLEQIPNALPALMKSAKAQKRATAAGVLKADPEAIRSLIEEILSRLGDDETTSSERERLLGELLFHAGHLVELEGKDSEQLLSQTTHRYIRRWIAQTSEK